MKDARDSSGDEIVRITDLILKRDPVGLRRAVEMLEERGCKEEAEYIRTLIPPTDMKST